MDDLTEMLKGTLEGCVLEIIDGEETYGYAITRRLNELGFADVVEGTVYTILLRLERNGLVQVTKRPSEVGPPDPAASAPKTDACRTGSGRCGGEGLGWLVTLVRMWRRSPAARAIRVRPRRRTRSVRLNAE